MLKPSAVHHVCVAVSLLMLAGLGAAATADMVSQMVHRDLPDGLLDRVASRFPGNGHLDEMEPSMFTADASLHLATPAAVSLTFLDERAGYHNEVGYFTFDGAGQVLDRQAVWADCSKGNPRRGYLAPGDTIDLGTFGAGVNLGFYLIPKGDPQRAWHTTVDALNPNQDNYTAYFFDEASGYGVLGFEDLMAKPAWGTAYDDAVLGISTTAVPEPATLSLLAIGLTGLLVRGCTARRRRALP
ncbi:MAG: PEP-CTERM sorting domain-containing protein [Planctomycetota bacterium]